VLANGDEHELPEPHAPFFFLSYVHTPEHPWVEKLFKDIVSEVFERAAFNGPAGFMDRFGIHPGGHWRNEIDRVLATCRVFVPLYSPRYFASKQCGYEWNAFEQRVLDHRARHRGGLSPIVPALWAPVPIARLPEVARRIQVTHADLGSDYAQEGFYTLIKNARYRDSYISAVQRLATHIIRAGEQTVLRPMPPDELGPLDNAFDLPDRHQSVASRLTIVVAAPTLDRLPAGCRPDYYRTSSAGWNPFHPEIEQSIAEYAADVATFHAYSPTVLPFEQGFDLIRTADPSAGLGLLLVDAWCAQDGYLSARLRELDALDLDWVGVVVAWNRAGGGGPGGPADLMDQLRGVMPRRLGPSRFSLTSLATRISTPEQLRARLPEVLATAFNSCLDHVAAFPPAGDARASTGTEMSDATGPGLPGRGNGRLR
jgi:FxsC-like protein